MSCFISQKRSMPGRFLHTARCCLAFGSHLLALCRYSSESPRDRLYTKEHEWAMVCDESPSSSHPSRKIFTVGITDAAQKSLGDIVFVDFPTISPGDVVHANDVLAIVESVKGASDVFSPISGTFSSFNESLREKPKTINRAPYSEGWICKIEVDADASHASEHLLSSVQYDKYCNG
ncbi:hypothetical protein MDAP_002610 [Mitosporidium daphniae]